MTFGNIVRNLSDSDIWPKFLNCYLHLQNNTPISTDLLKKKR